MDRFYLYFVLMKKGSVMKTIGKLQSAGLCAAFSARRRWPAAAAYLPAAPNRLSVTPRRPGLC